MHHDGTQAFPMRMPRRTRSCIDGRRIVFCHTCAPHTATRYPDAQGVSACPKWDLIPSNMSGDFPYSGVRAMHILLGCNQVCAVLCASPAPCLHARTEAHGSTMLGERKKVRGPSPSFLVGTSHDPFRAGWKLHGLWPRFAMADQPCSMCVTSKGSDIHFIKTVC